MGFYKTVLGNDSLLAAFISAIEAVEKRPSLKPVSGIASIVSRDRNSVARLALCIEFSSSF